MDINELFNKSKPATSGTGQKTKTISLVNNLNAKPLTYGLEKNLNSHSFRIEIDDSRSMAEKIKLGIAELGIVSPLDYARAMGAWKIIPELCIAAKGKSKSTILFFNQGMHDIRTIAADYSSQTAVALMKILMREKFEINPEYIEMEPDLPAMLKKADAALVDGQNALHYHTEYQSHLDLGEEWFDLTGLPFVYGFWAGHELAIQAADIKILQESYKLGGSRIEEISKEFATTSQHDWHFYKEYFTENVYYTLGEEEKAGLQEFYRYAFYYGLTEHIPDLHFYG